MRELPISQGILEEEGTFEGGGSDATLVSGCIFVDNGSSLFQSQFRFLSNETVLSLEHYRGGTGWLLR